MRVLGSDQCIEDGTQFERCSSDPVGKRRAVEIGQEIRAEHFAPVAAAIRFAEAMRKKARDGWGAMPSQRR